MSLVLANIGNAFKDSSLIDDGVDRLHRKFMVVFLSVVCIVVGGKQFVGDPIHCFLTSDVSSQSDYINSYCWTASTYQVMPDKDDPFDPFKSNFIDHNNGDVIKNGGMGTKKFISYYQWIPIVLSLQSLSFYLPYLIWRNMAKNSGLHLPNLMKGIYELASVQTNDKSRKAILEDACDLINQFLKAKKLRNLSWIPNLLIVSFLFGKSLYLINVFFQLWALHSFLQTNILAHSFEIVRKFIFEHDWTASPRFPIRTLCQFNAIPQMGNYLTTHTTHCVLPINLYNDKIYAVIALLMLLLTIMSVTAIAHWVLKLFAPFTKHRLVGNRLKASPNNVNAQKANEFINTHLGYDGRFILYLIDKNVSSGVCESVIDRLWQVYKEENFISPNGSIHSQPDVEANERTELYPNQKLKDLSCPHCHQTLPGNLEGKNCPHCSEIVDY